MAEYIKLKDAIREIEQINPVDYGAMWDYKKALEAKKDE